MLYEHARHIKREKTFLMGFYWVFIPIFDLIIHKIYKNDILSLLDYKNSEKNGK